MAEIPAHLIAAAALAEEAIALGNVARWRDSGGKGQRDGPVPADLRAKLKAAGPEVREYLKWNLQDTLLAQSPGTRAAWVASGVALGMWMPDADRGVI